MLPIANNITNKITAQTLSWVKSFVIALNICPFAKHVVDRGRLDIEVVYPEDLATMMHGFIAAIQGLDQDSTVETILLVCGSKFLDDFEFYLDICDQAEVWMSKHGYAGVYQCATFHPNYCFAGVSAADPGNYTNRSPYPMLHILRESSIDQALQYYGDTSSIPDENIATMHRIGLAKIQQLLQQIVTN